MIGVLVDIDGRPGAGDSSFASSEDEEDTQTMSSRDQSIFEQLRGLDLSGKEVKPKKPEVKPKRYTTRPVVQPLPRRQVQEQWEMGTQAPSVLSVGAPPYWPHHPVYGPMIPFYPSPAQTAAMSAQGGYYPPMAPMYGYPPSSHATGQTRPWGGRTIHIPPHSLEVPLRGRQLRSSRFRTQFEEMLRTFGVHR